MKNKNKPGEKTFSVVLLIIGLFFLLESIRMFLKEPTISSYGALPLFLSLVIVLFSTKIIFFEMRDDKNREKTKKSTKEIISDIIPTDVVVTLIMIIAYCVLLFIGIGFEISTVLFLMGSMTYFSKGAILKNLIYTAVVMIFILIVFQTIFQVILP